MQKPYRPDYKPDYEKWNKIGLDEERCSLFEWFLFCVFFSLLFLLLAVFCLTFMNLGVILVLKMIFYFLLDSTLSVFFFLYL